MIASSFGVILYVALQTGQGCESAFIEMARAGGFRSKDATERAAMSEFAAAACTTTNPDILWQLALQESSFRFQLARVNDWGNQVNIYEGEAALSFLQKLKPSDRSRNIDIGVMQFNWAWHHEGFQFNPLMALNPKAQVDHFVKSFSAEIYDRCRGRWIGCYHSSNDQSRAYRYEQEVVEKGRILRLYALRYIRKQRASLTNAQLVQLPSIQQADIDRLLAFGREVPLPRRRSSH